MQSYEMMYKYLKCRNAANVLRSLAECFCKKLNQSVDKMAHKTSEMPGIKHFSLT